jgi:hypothetical protein
MGLRFRGRAVVPARQERRRVAALHRGGSSAAGVSRSVFDVRAGMRGPALPSPISDPGGELAELPPSWRSRHAGATSRPESRPAAAGPAFPAGRQRRPLQQSPGPSRAGYSSRPAPAGPATRSRSAKHVPFSPTRRGAPRHYDRRAAGRGARRPDPPRRLLPGPLPRRSPRFGGVSGLGGVWNVSRGWCVPGRRRSRAVTARAHRGLRPLRNHANGGAEDVGA